MKAGKEISYFTLCSQIGGGGFGQIWKVQNTEDDEYYAMKIEPLNSQRKTLTFETNILKKLRFSDKFPKYIMDGQEDDFCFLVMELCGPNLATVAQNLPNKRFNPAQMSILFSELLTMMEQFHSTGYIHRDIKPQNICTRFNGNSPLLLLDYGVSKLFIDANRQHIEARDHAAAIGSPLYSSPNTADHLELSRRDDLFSLAYSILDLVGVQLPWKGIPDPAGAGRLKKSNPLSKLFAPFGENFVEIGKQIESLGYKDTPNYKQMRELAMRGSTLTINNFEWMSAMPKNQNFAKVAQKLGFNFDQNGFLLELCPYMRPSRTNKSPNSNEKEKEGGKCNIC